VDDPPQKPNHSHPLKSPPFQGGDNRGGRRLNSQREPPTCLGLDSSNKTEQNQDRPILLIKFSNHALSLMSSCLRRLKPEQSEGSIRLWILRSAQNDKARVSNTPAISPFAKGETQRGLESNPKHKLNKIPSRNVKLQFYLSSWQIKLKFYTPCKNNYATQLM